MPEENATVSRIQDVPGEVLNYMAFNFFDLRTVHVFKQLSKSFYKAVKETNKVLRDIDIFRNTHKLNIKDEISLILLYALANKTSTSPMPSQLVRKVNGLDSS